MLGGHRPSVSSWAGQFIKFQPIWTVVDSPQSIDLILWRKANWCRNLGSASSCGQVPITLHQFTHLWDGTSPNQFLWKLSMSRLNQGHVFRLESSVNSGPWGGMCCLLDAEHLATCLLWAVFPRSCLACFILISCSCSATGLWASWGQEPHPWWPCLPLQVTHGWALIQPWQAQLGHYRVYLPGWEV